MRKNWCNDYDMLFTVLCEVFVCHYFFIVKYYLFMDISYTFAFVVLYVVCNCYQLIFKIFQIIMKTKNFIVCMLLGLIAVPAMSQSVEETKADSLQQVVDEISEKNKQLEAEALDKKIWKDRAKYFNILLSDKNFTRP